MQNIEWRSCSPPPTPLKKGAVRGGRSTHIYDGAFCNTIFEAPTKALRGGGFSKMVLQNPHRKCVLQCNSDLGVGFNESEVFGVF